MIVRHISNDMLGINALFHIRIDNTLYGLYFQHLAGIRTRYAGPARAGRRGLAITLPMVDTSPTNAR